mgnify:CR=1 FL=1
MNLDTNNKTAKYNFSSRALANIDQYTLEDRKARTANSTFTIGGVSCSVDSLVVAESFVLQINISGKNPALRKSAKR